MSANSSLLIKQTQSGDTLDLLQFENLFNQNTKPQSTQNKQRKNIVEYLDRDGFIKFLCEEVKNIDEFKRIPKLDNYFKLDELSNKQALETLKPFFRICYMDSTLKMYLNLLMDSYIDAASIAYWNSLKNEKIAYCDESIIGLGPNGFKLAVARLTYSGANPISIDLRPRIGGQFSVSNYQAWRTNSRGGMDSMMGMQELIPGLGLNLNSLGRNSLVDTGDLDTEKIPFQDVIAFAVKINFLLIGYKNLPYLVNTKVLDQLPIGRNGATEYFKTELYNSCLNETLTMFTRRITNVTGVGKPKPMTPAKRRISIEEFFKKSHMQELRELLESSDTIAIKGAGDSGAVVIEQILGYYGSLNLAKTPSKIYWYGQANLNKSDFENCGRARYNTIAVDFPRKGTNAAHRIYPIPKKVTKDEVIGNKILITDESKRVMEFDLLIDCSGLVSYLETEDEQFQKYFKEVKQVDQKFEELFSINLKDKGTYEILFELDYEKSGIEQLKLNFELPRPPKCPVPDKLESVKGLKAGIEGYRALQGSRNIYTAEIRELEEKISFYTTPVPYEKVPPKLSYRSTKDIQLNAYLEGFLKEYEDNFAQVVITPDLKNSLIYKFCINLKDLGVINSVSFQGQKLNLVSRDIEDFVFLDTLYSGALFNKKEIARKAKYKELYVAGPAAKLKPSLNETKAIRALDISENVVALWFHDERIEETAKYQSKIDKGITICMNTELSKAKIQFFQSNLVVNNEVSRTETDANLKYEMLYPQILKSSLRSYSDWFGIDFKSLPEIQLEISNESVFVQQNGSVGKVIIPDIMLKAWTKSPYFQAAVRDLYLRDLKSYKIF